MAYSDHAPDHAMVSQSFGLSRATNDAQCHLLNWLGRGTFLFILVSSVALADASPSEAESLQAQVSRYWGALKNFDLATAYQMEEGAASGTLSPLTFRQQWSETDWDLVEYEIRSAELIDEAAEVEIELTFAVPQLPKNLSRTITDHWIMRGEQWLRARPAANAAASSNGTP